LTESSAELVQNIFWGFAVHNVHKGKVTYKNCASRKALLSLYRFSE